MMPPAPQQRSDLREVHNELRWIVASTDSQSQGMELELALKYSVRKDRIDHWELFDKLDKDTQLKSAFGERMFRSWAAKIDRLDDP